MRFPALLPVLTLVFLLSACGSDSDSPTPADNADTGGSSGGSGDSGNSTSVVGNCSLTPDEQALLDAHNAARAEARVCGTVSMPAAPPLDWHCTLGEVAFAHSKDMGDNDFFDHTGSDGRSPSRRVKDAGYDYRYTGENIAAGQPDVASVMQSWIDSPGHCENLMSPNYTQMGGGIYSTSSARYSIYWTVDFGKPK